MLFILKALPTTLLLIQRLYSRLFHRVFFLPMLSGNVQVELLGILYVLLILICDLTKKIYGSWDYTGTPLMFPTSKARVQNCFHHVCKWRCLLSNLSFRDKHLWVFYFHLQSGWNTEQDSENHSTLPDLRFLKFLKLQPYPSPLVLLGILLETIFRVEPVPSTYKVLFIFYWINRNELYIIFHSNFYFCIIDF